MGQIISNLVRWLSPKSRRNETTQRNDLQSNYNHQTYYVYVADNESNNQVDENNYYINISDDFEPVSGPKNDEDNSLEYNSSASSAHHIVLDLIGENGEESVEDRVIKKEVVLEKNNVTTAVNYYVSYNKVVVGKIGAYTSDQRLLLVGEGDFSFSASLAVAFGYSSRNIIATSLNPRDFLIKNYRKFGKNKAELESRGSLVIHGVDATKMVDHPILGSMVFDRVIYNFPHAGQFGQGDLELHMHQKLISGFLQNAKKLIGEDGEIHITSKCNGFFGRWDIPKLGSDQGLCLIQARKFNRLDYPGYRTKYGFGGDANFRCNPSKTYKFGLSSN